MATETDAARDRVLAARAALGEELEILEASARAAVDIPAKIRRSPAKAAAVAGGDGVPRAGRPAARLPRGQAGGHGRAGAAARRRCCPRRSRRPCARWATTARRSAARSSAISRPTPSRGQRTDPDLRTLHRPDRRPAAAVRLPRRRPPAGCSAPTTRDFQARLAQIRDGPSGSRAATTRREPTPTARSGRDGHGSGGRRRRGQSDKDPGKTQEPTPDPGWTPRRALRLRGGRVAEWQTRRP